MNKFLSRKFLVAIGAAIVAFVGSAWPEQADLVEQIVYVAIGYIVVQGIVDTATEVRGTQDVHK